jgi:hypothetical protein
MMERIVYLDRSALRTAVRRPAFEHEWIGYPTTRPEEVKARLKGATIAITSHRTWPGPARGRWPTWRNNSSKTSKRLCADRRAT